MIEFRDVSFTVPDSDILPDTIPAPQTAEEAAAQAHVEAELEALDDLKEEAKSPRRLQVLARRKIADSKRLLTERGQGKWREAARQRIMGARGRRYILNEVSFVVPERSITCIMGVSGQGKTTLLRLMAGLLQPDSGQILINGKNIVGLDENKMNEVRRDMGFVFQYGALFDSLTVAENVAFGLEEQRRPKKEIAEIVTARLRDAGLPDKNVQNKLPSEISGGMRKRVAMARAIATNPSIVLYDEPTSGLDPVMARIIDDLVIKLRDQNGTTNVVVSHSLPSILRISDRVIMLYDGHIEVEGTPEEVQNSDSAVVQQFLRGEAVGPITLE